MIVRTKPTSGNIDADGNLRPEELVEDDFELVDDDEDLKMPTKGKRALMPIELL